MSQEYEDLSFKGSIRLKLGGSPGGNRTNAIAKTSRGEVIHVRELEGFQPCRLAALQATILLLPSRPCLLTDLVLAAERRSGLSCLILL